MTIEGRIDGVKRLMDRVHDYEHMIIADNFEPATIDDMKGNAKALCDAAKAEIDSIKAEIDLWS